MLKTFFNMINKQHCDAISFINEAKVITASTRVFTTFSTTKDNDPEPSSQPTSNETQTSTESETPPPAPAPKLIPVTIEYEGELFHYNFPLYSKLAPNLDKARVPLEFSCGYACSCGTCSLAIENEEHLNKLNLDQPPSEFEEAARRENNLDDNTRLSCQLFVMDYFRDIKFIVNE